MKPAPFCYHDPRSIDDLVTLLRDLENARLLAGGQSLVPMLNMRFAMPDHVIDMNRIPALSGIHEDRTGFRVGAMTRQVDLMRSGTLMGAWPVIGEALQQVGHFQTRNRGTFGGSLCHLDPSAELVCIAAAAEARLSVQSHDGTREIAMSDWPDGYMTPAIRADEVLTNIRLPRCEFNGQAFTEFARRHGDFAIIGVAALVSIEDDRIRKAAIAIAGLGAAPIRLTSAEKGLQGENPGDDTWRSAGAEAARMDAMEDAYVSAAYRKRLAGVLVERALAKAARRAKEAC